ncbi:MAG: TIGR03986 family CRISPR-associated RAMP protein [Clostridia bacterium]|nr:TIGR03986 family CRISPR-associated RAMP protein [Clostridia bacterium]
MKWEEKEEKDERFVNPYNFVPFEEKCGRFPVEGMPSGKTGYLDCRLEVLTPLFIPNTSNDKALQDPDNFKEDAYSYDFFSYTNLGTKVGAAMGNYKEPIIPGSEIRGAVRSVFEAAFNGCMSSVDLKRPLGRRSGDPKEAGILEKTKGEQWEITPCERWKFNTADKELINKIAGKETTYENLSEGQSFYVYVGSGGRSYPKNRNKTRRLTVDNIRREKPMNSKDWNLAYLHKGERFESKKGNESVFVPQNNKKISVSEDDVKRLREVVLQYRDPKINKKQEGKGWYNGYEIREDKKTLVYYQKGEVGTPVYMAPACISREVFRKSIKEILQENGNYQPCEDRDNVCSACSLFGMIASEPENGDQSNTKNPDKSEGRGLASRVRFSDARIENLSKDSDWEKYYMPDTTLPEMGEPKPSTVEFYTFFPYEKKPRKDSYGYWTYDYKMVGKNREILPKGQPKLRGRKFYWHSNAWENFVEKNESPINMRQRIRPLREKLEDGQSKPIIFQFCVYFENSTAEELKRLRWALTFDDPECAHKIGRAKPLGFGSVRISVEDEYVRKIDEKTGEWSCQRRINQTDSKIKETASIKSLKEMVNWKKKPIPTVCYPLIEVKGENHKEKKANDEASHQWFLGNRSRVKGANPMRPMFSKVLPKPEEETDGDDSSEKWLYKLEKE